MPELTGIEETMLNELNKKACSLKNGKRGDLNTISDVVAETAHVVIAIARCGGPTWLECQRFRDEYRRGILDWKALLVICGTIMGIVYKFFP